MILHYTVIATRVLVQWHEIEEYAKMVIFDDGDIGIIVSTIHLKSFVWLIGEGYISRGRTQDLKYQNKYEMGDRMLRFSITLTDKGSKAYNAVCVMREMLDHTTEDIS